MSTSDQQLPNAPIVDSSPAAEAQSQVAQAAHDPVHDHAHDHAHDHFHGLSHSPPESISPGKVEDTFYDILAGGSKYALFCSLFDMDLPALLLAGGKTTEQIISALGLSPHRARKWLHALRLTGLLEPSPRNSVVDDSDPLLTLGPAVLQMVGTDGKGGYFYREFLRYYRASMAYSLPYVLRGAPVEYAVRYPPTAWADIVLLHEWMRNTALVTLQVLRRHVEYGTVKHLLDVGGGDGTMAFELWRDFPTLSITIFNLPAPVAMANQTALQLGAAGRVRAVAGDFRTDALPGPVDMVMFSRVLADWPTELCQELLRKAYAALSPGGTLVICEPLADENPGLAVAWEQSYLPYDDFGLYVYKPLPLYLSMLAQQGFVMQSIHPRDSSTIHTVLIAKKPV